MNKNFNEILKEKRKSSRMTQQELAEKLNVTDKTVSKWETGKYYPDITLIASIATALNTTVSELMSSDDLTKEDINDEITFDSNEINNYKSKMILSLGLLSSVLLILLIRVLYIVFINNDTGGISNISSWSGYKLAMTISAILIFVCVLCSITIFIATSIKFRDFYLGTFYQSRYQIVFYRYSMLCLQSIIFLISVLVLGYIWDKSLVYRIVVFIISFVLTIIIANIIKRMTDCKFKNDYLNKVYLILAILFFVAEIVLLLVNLNIYLLILFSYIALQIYFQRNIYLNNKI